MTISFRSSAVTLALVLSALLSLTSCATVDTPPPAEVTTTKAYAEGVPGGVFVNTLEVSARVMAIDASTRKAKLLGPDGKTFMVKAGPHALNFDQIAVGDLVRLTVTEELIVYVSDGSESSDSTAGLVALAPKGAQPGGLLAETTQTTGTVTAIDQSNRTATLRFEDGSEKVFPVRSDVDLGKRAVGEKVIFHTTEMIAISVSK